MSTQAWFPELHKPRLVVNTWNLSIQEGIGARRTRSSRPHLATLRVHGILGQRPCLEIKEYIVSALYLYNFCSFLCWFLFYSIIILRDTNSHFILFFVLSRLALWPKMWFILEKVHWTTEMATDFTAAGCNGLFTSAQLSRAV